MQGAQGAGCSMFFLLLKVTKTTRKVSNEGDNDKKLLKKVQRIKIFAIFARYYYQFLTIKKVATMNCWVDIHAKYTDRNQLFSPSS